MKNRFLINFIVLSISIMAIGKSNCIYAAESNHNIPIDEIVSVEIALMKPGIFLSEAMTEVNLFRTQCVFASDDGGKISNLVDIIQNNIELPARSRVSRVDLRNAIYFNKKDKSKIKYLMSDSDADRIVNGNRYENGHGSPFLASEILLVKLRKWSRQGVELKSGRGKEYCNGVNE